MTAGEGSPSGKRGGPITVEGIQPPHGVRLPPREGAVQPGSAVPPPVKVIEMEEERTARRRALAVVFGVLLAAAVVLGAVWARSVVGR